MQGFGDNKKSQNKINKNLNNDFFKNQIINQAIQLKPDDPVIMNHYGDILWKLNRKLQAKYFWENVLKINNFKEINKNELQLKLIKGI